MYFPMLHQDELLYSALARCRIHLGLDSQKELLRQHFSDPWVAATTDLPNHLRKLLQNIGRPLGLDAALLVRRHTLFPLYAPFITPERRGRLEKAMVEDGESGTLGLSGITTAAVKWPPWLRLCPTCLAKMHARHGEYYWRREWQVIGANACIEHLCRLRDSRVPFRRISRYDFQAASPWNCPHRGPPDPADVSDLLIARGVRQLLSSPGAPSPTFRQWSRFYHSLAVERGATTGHHVRIDMLWQRVLSSHSSNWLDSNGLLISKAPYWFVAMFRKHRKSFSFLQHLTVWGCFRQGQDAGSLLLEVARLPDEDKLSDEVSQVTGHTDRQLFRQREKWLKALSKAGGTKRAREQGGQAIYFWLYRHDRQWLMATNASRKVEHGNHCQIDWAWRDRQLARRLIRVEGESAEDLATPRRSQTWFLSQLPHSASVEKNLHRLPLCSAFLDKYAESLGEYQVRRLTKVLINDALAGRARNKWELKRLCGLQSSRTTELARCFLQGLDETL
ncbi:TnsD family Tn7-like transposition protein [Halomonas sp. GXIMD04776]|uniref:TnsD family Tn7-like transposition protein n=1 Tax=Halomonas sp. GXIMD04776 TaxID=3415605 RepID=UPI003CBB90DD